MRAVDLAVALVQQVRQTGVCPFCAAFDAADAHTDACPVGRYERNGYNQGLRFITNEPFTPSRKS